MTLIQIGMERNVEGRTIAWALDYPGVFTYGADDAEALTAYAPPDSDVRKLA